jgi:signal transduction histidine kinase
MLEKLIAYYTPSQSKQSEVDFDVKKNNIFIQWSITIISFLFLFAGMNYTGGKMMAAHIDMGLIAAILGILHFYKLTAKREPALLGFFTSVMLMLSFQHINAPWGMGSNLIWLTPLFLTSVYLIEMRKSYKYFLAFTIGLFLFSEWASYKNLFHFDEFTNAEIFNYNTSTIVMALLGAGFLGRKMLREEQKIKNQLHGQYHELAELNQTNSALISMVTHDLANPISVISFRVTQIKLALKKGQIDKISELQGKMEHDVQRCIDLMEKVKEMKAIESGKMEIKLRPVDLKCVINSSVEVLDHKIKSKNISIILEQPNQDIIVTGEPVSMINSVFNNLISNALKFSPQNSKILIQIEDGVEQATVRFRDYGIGMPNEIKSHIFDPQKATTRRGTNGESGTGFGLPLTKMFIDKYEAKIQVWSSTNKQNHGTEFTLTFNKTERLDNDQAA